ncbi:hypothetical protein DENSPDRAFT_226610 [Dentipellis sp. KUC8613]|nr:hypothetical protein DENSPDRAFT_226610 [Dentipellis sp. KUC8613]
MSKQAVHKSPPRFRCRSESDRRPGPLLRSCWPPGSPAASCVGGRFGQSQLRGRCSSSLSNTRISMQVEQGVTSIRSCPHEECFMWHTRNTRFSRRRSMRRQHSKRWLRPPGRRTRRRPGLVFCSTTVWYIRTAKNTPNTTTRTALALTDVASTVSVTNRTNYKLKDTTRKP